MSSVYRTHTCGQLRPEHVGQQARLSGWVQRKRDHGNLLFIDLRDHYGVTQVVVDVSSPVFKTAEAVRNESVITVSGKVVAREASTVNPRLATGAGRARRRRRWSSSRWPSRCRSRSIGERHHARGAAAEIPLPRPAQGQAAQEHRAAQPGHRQPAPAHDRAGLHRVPDADPDRRLARRARAPTWCRAGCIPASSTRCRRRRRCSSSC